MTLVLIPEYNVNFTIIVKMIFMMANVVVVTNVISKRKKKKKVCTEVSFMIFRTGSVLIVGHCDEQILNIVYKFIRKMLIDEYSNISQITKENYIKKIYTKDSQKRNISFN